MALEADVLREQRDYYRARAGEYDQWFFREGRYDRGPEFRARWEADAEEVRTALRWWLAPPGDTLELAGGTGLWTEHLAQGSSSVRVLDGSPETLAISAERCQGLNVAYEVADLFEWRPDRRYSRIFFGFWLSHVPEARFDAFFAMLEKALEPEGSVFLVDSLLNPESTAMNHQLDRDAEDETMVRELNDGRTFRIVKRFYSPESLTERLKSLGWTADLHGTDDFFLYGTLKPPR